MKFDDRTLWYQAICYPVLEHDLEEMQDSEEEKMLDELVFLFRECEQCAEVSKAADNDKTVEAFSFGMATNKGTNLRTQTYVLRKQDKKRAA